MSAYCLYRRIATAVVLAIGIILGPGTALVHAQTPPWVLSGASVDLDFVHQQYYYSGGFPLSLTRASTGYASDSTGKLISFGSGVARITDLGALLEESRTNLLLQSQFASSWTNNGHASVTANQATSPDTTTDAATLVEDNTNNAHYIYQGVAKAAQSLTYSVTVYASRAATGSARDVVMTAVDSTIANGVNVSCNLSTGTVGYWISGSGFSIVSKTMQQFTNGFWRCTVVLTTNADTTLNVAFQLAQAGTGTTGYTGDGASGVYLYGAQLEQASFPTSYIATTNAAATRAADVVSVSGQAQTILTSGTGTALAVVQGGEATGAAANIIDSNGTALLDLTSSDTLTDAVVASLTTTNTANRIGGYDSVAVAWDGSGRTLVLNAGSAVTDSRAQAGSTPLHIGSTGTANFLDGYLARLTLWTTKQSNPQSFFNLVNGTTVFGANLSGAWQLYNVSGTYVPEYPSSSDWAYMKSKGVTLACWLRGKSCSRHWGNPSMTRHHMP